MCGERARHPVSLRPSNEFWFVCGPCCSRVGRRPHEPLAALDAGVHGKLPLFHEGLPGSIAQ
eukprot:3609436-Prorocentrum_lima.AAC.1